MVASWARTIEHTESMLWTALLSSADNIRMLRCIDARTKKNALWGYSRDKMNILCFNKIWYDARCQKGTVGPGHWKMTWIDFTAFLSFLEQREFGLRLHETKRALPRIQLKRGRGSHTCTKLSKKGILFTTCLYGLKCSCQLKIIIESMLTMGHRPTPVYLSSSFSMQPSRPMSVWSKAHSSVPTSGRSTHWGDVTVQLLPMPLNWMYSQYCCATFYTKKMTTFGTIITTQGRTTQPGLAILHSTWPSCTTRILIGFNYKNPETDFWG